MLSFISAKQLIDRLRDTQTLDRADFVRLITEFTPDISEYLFEQSRAVRQKYYGNSVFIRGLIEFSNYCKNDCYYCGIRRSNKNASRYRLTEDEILSCCEHGYALGFRTFVLQGGEDPWFTDERLVSIISNMRAGWPDCAITLSLGERSAESYQKLFDAGANRYLLRHETYDARHYEQLHPAPLTSSHRQNCLFQLKKIGFQTGAGFMVGSPHQTAENIADDLLFLKKLDPQMVGIGPFIPHHDTPFAKEPAGSVELTLFLLGLVRLLLPEVLLPATTALGTMDPHGREKGILAGANVVMPNLSPDQVRKKYLLYDNKLCTGTEAAEQLEHLKHQMASIGYHVSIDRGDCHSVLFSKNTITE